VDDVARPALALAVLAALERRGGRVDEPAPRLDASIADVLCDRGVPPGAGGLAGAIRLLRAITGDSAERAVADLVTGPLGVERDLRIAGLDGPVATAAALRAVATAWVRLTVGRSEPDLPTPTPAMVRRAWVAASHLARNPRTGAPEWRGPGVRRNVGAALSAMASPLAFGQRARRGHALALADPVTGRVAVVVRAPGAAPGVVQAALDAQLVAVTSANARAVPRASA
jgi:hypothetical protein